MGTLVYLVNETSVSLMIVVMIVIAVKRVLVVNQ